MKKILVTLFLIPFLGFSQVQIGQDIVGEATLDRFGQAISISADGLIVAIGGYRNSPSSATNPSYVRVYENQFGNWVQLGQTLVGSEVDDRFGNHVSLSSDGTILAIGAHLNDSNGANAGQVRIYKFESNVWTQVGQDINGENSQSQFGSILEISSDGSKIAVGAPADNNSGILSGSVRVFENQSNVWTQIGQTINGEAAQDRLGVSLSLSSNGTTLAITSSGNDNAGTNFGNVRVFEYQSNNWVQKGQDIEGTQNTSVFGFGIKLSSNGNIIVIGDSSYDTTLVNSGAVRVYELQFNTWTQIGSDIYGEEENDGFGINVSISPDGTVFSSVAFGNDGNALNAGRVRFFKNELNVWTQIGQSIDGEFADDFTNGAVLSSDLSTVIVGASNNDSNGIDSGYARVFDISGLALSLNTFTLNNISIHPNPTSTFINIELSNPSELKKVSIYNNLGQLISEGTKTKIDVSNNSKGIYFAEIETKKGKITKKFIVE